MYNNDGNAPSYATMWNGHGLGLSRYGERLCIVGGCESREDVWVAGLWAVVVRLPVQERRAKATVITKVPSSTFPVLLSPLRRSVLRSNWQRSPSVRFCCQLEATAKLVPWGSAPRSPTRRERTDAGECN